MKTQRRQGEKDGGREIMKYLLRGLEKIIFTSSLKEV